jgi:hypothetical protein
VRVARQQRRQVIGQDLGGDVDQQRVLAESLSGSQAAYALSSLPCVARPPFTGSPNVYELRCPTLESFIHDTHQVSFVPYARAR